MAEHYTELVRRTGVDRRDLASTYVLRPLTIALSQILEYGVHRVYEAISEYTGEDGEDRETRGSRKWVHYG